MEYKKLEQPIREDQQKNDVLTERVSIGGGWFEAGVKVSTVLDAARRLYLYQQKQTGSRLPISIAPSNVLILCYLPNGNSFVGKKRDAWFDSFGAELRGVRPTQWQHLP